MGAIFQFDHTLFDRCTYVINRNGPFTLSCDDDILPPKHTNVFSVVAAPTVVE